MLAERGTLAIWLYPITFGVPGSVLRTGLFTSLGKRNGVHRFRRARRA